MFTIEQIKKLLSAGEILNLKYVRFANNEYRFTDIYGEHKSLVNDGEVAISAGQIGCYDNYIRLEGGSMGLKLTSLPDDKLNITKLLFEL